MRWNVNDLGILGRLVDFELHHGAAIARRHRGIETDAAIHGLHQHRLPANIGIVKAKLALRAALRVRNFLHAAHRLDQCQFDAGSRLARRAVLHCSAHRSRMRDAS